MKKYQYVEPGRNDETVYTTITEEEIIEHYFPVWSQGMKRIGKENQISRERCIEDFCTIHWAHEVK